MTNIAEVFVGLLLAVALFALLARKVAIPYPILFVIGGLLLSVIPSVPRVRLEPDLVFMFFLPPLLFPAALFTSWRDFRANIRIIGFLAVGLVLLTSVAVAYLAHHFMGLPLSAGFILGAIVSPPDAVAASAIAKRLKIPRQIVTILEGESLVNDASALVVYRFGIAAAVSAGSFSLTQAGERFLVVGLGGIAIGLALGWLVAQFHRQVDDAPIEITVSLLTPFAAYLLAERCHTSGVLAVVAAGLHLGWRAPEIVSSNTRLQGIPVWQMVEFLLNGIVFILIGLQLPEAMRALMDDATPIYKVVWEALLIWLAVTLIRIVWVFAAAYVPRWMSPKLRARDPYPKWQHVAIVGWTGMRGVVSLAAALALPLTTNNNLPFPGRDLILVMTFVVILATLVGQGLTLPGLIRWLGVKDDGLNEMEERDARLRANREALAWLNETKQAHPAKAEVLGRLVVEYEDHIKQVESSEHGVGAVFRLFSSEYERLSLEALEKERRTIFALRNQSVIGDETMRRIQRDIDLAEARLRRL